MGSRLVEGLYFCGEVMDLDADTGGYNLQAAFSTGYIAGRARLRNAWKPLMVSLSNHSGRLNSPFDKLRVIGFRQVNSRIARHGMPCRYGDTCSRLL